MNNRRILFYFIYFKKTAAAQVTLALSSERMAGTEHAGEKFCQLAGPAAAYVCRPRIRWLRFADTPNFCQLINPLSINFAKIRN
jgi:hypothetical protein